MSLFIALAAILIGFCFWQINGHRLRTTSRILPGTRPDTPSRPEETLDPDASAHLDRATFSAAERPMAVRDKAGGRRLPDTRDGTDGSSR
jgi:hypothetical protein